MIREKKLFIEDILESINNIESFSKGMTKNKLSKDKLRQSAIIRQIEIIGEAVKNLPIDFISRYPEVSWRYIAGMRDVVIHSYFQLDIDKVWNVIKDDLPTLKQQIQKIKRDLEESG